VQKAASRRRDLIRDYSNRLLDKLAAKTDPDSPRTYGFEYEFLPESPPSPDCIDKTYNCLHRVGFHKKGKMFYNKEGMGVNFEPGGQIEYHSPPILPEDHPAFLATLDLIENINETIRKECGIHYLAKGYISGRAKAPLCLSAGRYIKLHERLSRTGTRGLEMMKGTASIHLHASITDTGELPALFGLMQALAKSEDFRMSPERRDIWNNTDPCRCGMPYAPVGRDTSPLDVIGEFVRVAVDADILGADIPFFESEAAGFEDFLYHLTTIFTDIRLNVDSATLELRTPDSVPADLFFEKWKRFVDAVKTGV